MKKGKVNASYFFSEAYLTGSMFSRNARNVLDKIDTGLRILVHISSTMSCEAV